MFSVVRSLYKSGSHKHLSLSHVKGSHAHKAVYKSVAQVFREVTDKYPNNFALHSYDQDKSFTYEQIYKRASELATGFMEIGLKPKDRIAIYSYNRYEWYLVQLASALADLILVNINPAYMSEELAYTINKVGCKVLITSPQFKSSNYLNIIRELIPNIEATQGNHIQSTRMPSLQRIYKFGEDRVPGFLNFDDIYRPIGKDFPNSKPEDPANIQFTSGTTGLPKACILSHINIINNAYEIGVNTHYTDKDSICLPVPLYHCFGMVMGTLTGMVRGATSVLVCEGFDPKKALQAITKYKCTSLYGVPTMFLEYLRVYNENKHEYDVKSLRTGIVAGALCPEILMNRCVNELNIKALTNCYGMTETAPVSFQTHPSDTLAQKTQTVGRILPRLEGKIVNEKGETLPIGQAGEVLVKGETVMLGYWGDEAATKKSIVDGWMKTGDVGVLDADGYLTIVGRLKDMIIRGGENIYPKEIEEYLRKMPGVHDIQVVGIPDPKFGEETVALIKLNDNANMQPSDVFNFCKGKIAHYKIPKFVKFVKSFPTTVTGKQQKYKMREDLIH